MSWLDALLKRPTQDVHIELPGAVTAEFNHRLKVCFVYHDDPDVSETAYDKFEAHLNRQGYEVVLIKAPIISRHK